MQESFQPPPNRPDNRGLRTALERAARRVLDLQVRTVEKAVSAWLPRRTGQVLEVGCGLQPYRRYLPPEVGYVGLDWAGAGEGFGYSVPDVVHYDGGRFPFDDGRFDSVFHTELLEHVFDVMTLLSECRRVLRPGGEMLLTVPFQARFHYIPHDYWRFTPSALRRMLEEAGFEEIDVRPRGTDVTVAGYKGVGVAYRLLSGSVLQKIGGVLLAPVGLLALGVAHLSLALGLGSPDDCLGYTVVCRARHGHPG